MGIVDGIATTENVQVTQNVKIYTNSVYIHTQKNTNSRYIHTQKKLLSEICQRT